MTTITVTDQIGTDGTATIDSFDLAETIRPWFEGMGEEVAAAVEEIGDAARAGQWEAVNDLAVFLGIDVQIA